MTANLSYSILSLLFGYAKYNCELVRTEFYVPLPSKKNNYKLVGWIYGKATQEEAEHMLSKIYEQSKIETQEGKE